MHGHIITHQCRRCVQSYRRQLGAVAYENQFTLHACTYKTDKIIQKIASTECRSRLLLTGIYADKRRLIYNEECRLILVRTESKLAETITADRFLTVYVLMNSICMLSGIR